MIIVLHVMYCFMNPAMDQHTHTLSEITLWDGCESYSPLKLDAKIVLLFLSLTIDAFLYHTSLKAFSSQSSILL